MFDDKGVSMPVFMFVLLIVGLIVAGGFTLVLPQSNPAGTYGMGDNGKTISVSQGSIVQIKLDENPTTGYGWNVSTTPGLSISDSNYVSGNFAPGMVGVGGVHVWTVVANDKGQQQFSGIYKRPWEPTVGNETSFSLTIDVT